MTDFIGEYEIRQESVEAVLSFFKEHKHLARPGGIWTGSKVTVDTDHKESLDLLINPHDFPPCLMCYIEDLTKALDQYKEEFVYCSKKQFFWGIREVMQLQYYKPGGGYKAFHYENQGSSIVDIQRHLVFMTYLNTIPSQEGGGTEFLYQRSFNAVAGKTLIWPAIWTHTHRGIISPTKEKYIITGWYSYNLLEY
jgi:prolyl 4-hydroxylase